MTSGKRKMHRGRSMEHKKKIEKFSCTLLNFCARIIFLVLLHASCLTRAAATSALLVDEHFIQRKRKKSNNIFSSFTDFRLSIYYFDMHFFLSALILFFLFRNVLFVFIFKINFQWRQ